MPTEAEVQGQISLAVQMFHNAQQYGHVSVPNILSDIAAIIQNLDGDFSVDHLNAVEAVRAQFAGVYSTPSVASALSPLLLEYAKIIGSPHTDVVRIMVDLRRFLIAAGTTVQERNITYDSPAPGGSNVGNGTLHRLTVDQYGQNLENVHLELRTVRCTADAFSNAQEQEETFEIKGVDANKDQINIQGSGLVGAMSAISARASESFITNPGFEATQYSDLQTITDLGGWEVLSGGFTNLQLAQDVYRNYPGIGTVPLALKFTGSDTIYQSLDGRAINPAFPMFLQIALKRENNADGDVELRLGNTTFSVNLAAQVGWFTHFLPLNKDLWFDSFNKTDLRVEIEYKNHTTGELLVDDVTMVQMVPFDRTYHVIIGGPTPFLREDTFTWTDVLVGPDAKIQYWFWRGFGEYLPSSGTPTWPDP